MGCLNQWDQQSHRLFSPDGAMQTLYAGENAGGNTVGVFVKKKRKRKVKSDSVVGVDGYNASLTNDVTMSLTGQRIGVQNIPSVIVKRR